MINDKKSLRSMLDAIGRQQCSILGTVRNLKEFATIERVLSAKDLEHYKDMSHSFEEAKKSIENLQYWLSEALMLSILIECPRGSIIGSYWVDDVLKLASQKKEKDGATTTPSND